MSGAFARSIGYGKTKGASHDEGNAAPNQVDGPVNSPEKCAKIYQGYLRVLQPHFICVGYGEHGCLADSCHGDSGGPLIQFDGQKRAVQIGIVSFGLECGSKGVPGVYVRVSAFIDWMQAVGAVFAKSGDAVALFAEGSKEAASDEATITVAQIVSSESDAGEDSSQLTISKVTFAMICVIAGIALIGFIFLSLAYVSGRGRFGGSRGECVHGGGEEGVGTGQRDSGFIGGQSGNGNYENLQLAISILQSIRNEQAQRVGNEGRGEDAVEEERGGGNGGLSESERIDVVMEEGTVNRGR